MLDDEKSGAGRHIGAERLKSGGQGFRRGKLGAEATFPGTSIGVVRMTGLVLYDGL